MGRASSRRVFVVCLGSVVALLATPAAAAAGTSHLEGHAMAPADITSSQYESMGDFDDLSSVILGCQTTVPARCFGPAQLRAAYGIQPLLSAGTDGTGRTIVLVDAYQSPTIVKDLGAFDTIWHLPAPPSFNVLHPFGLTPFDRTDGVQVGWSREISIDVE